MASNTPPARRARPQPACCNATACTAQPDGVCSARMACGGAPPLPGGGNNQCYYDKCAMSPDVFVSQPVVWPCF